MPQGFDVEAARQAGYSDDEIIAHLTSTRAFDVEGAKKSGYSPADIINHLSTSAPSTPASQDLLPPNHPAPSAVGQALGDIAGVPVGFANRAIDTVKGIGQMAMTPAQPGFEQAVTAPTFDPMTALGGRALMGAKRLFVDPQVARYDKAKEAYEQGNIGNAIGYGMQAAAPIVGPLLGSLADVYEQKGPSEALGAATFDALTMLLGKRGNTALKTRAATLPERAVAKGRQAITDFIRPADTNYKFEQFRDTALGDIVREAQLARAGEQTAPGTLLGRVFAGLRSEPKLIGSGKDFLDAISAGKDRLWQAREAAITPYRDAVVISGDKLADVARGQIKPYMLREPKFAGFVKQMNELADAYAGQQIPLAEAEARLAKLNADLKTSYGRRRGNTALPEEGLPTQADDAMANALRKEIYGKVERVAGSNVADLMRRYGALSEMQDATKPIVTNIERYGRPSVPGMMLETGLDTGAGAIYSKSGALIRAGRGIAKMLKLDEESRLVRGMEGLRNEAAPMPLGNSSPYTLANRQLPAGATHMPPVADPSNVWASPAMPGVQTGQRTLPPGSGALHEMPPVPDQTRTFTGPELQGTTLGYETQGGPAYGTARTTNRPTGTTMAISTLTDENLKAARNLAANIRPDILPALDAEIAKRATAAKKSATPTLTDWLRGNQK